MCEFRSKYPRTFTITLHCNSLLMEDRFYKVTKHYCRFLLRKGKCGHWYGIIASCFPKASEMREETLTVTKISLLHTHSTHRLNCGKEKWIRHSTSFEVMWWILLLVLSAAYQVTSFFKSLEIMLLEAPLGFGSSNSGWNLCTCVMKLAVGAYRPEWRGL